MSIVADTSSGVDIVASVMMPCFCNKYISLFCVIIIVFTV